jgi:hypothetical protein
VIKLVIEGATLRKSSDYGWLVRHPTNDAILAYCDTEKEAKRVSLGLRSLLRPSLFLEPFIAEITRQVRGLEKSQKDPTNSKEFCMGQQEALHWVLALLEEGKVPE